MRSGNWTNARTGARSALSCYRKRGRELCQTYLCLGNMLADVTVCFFVIFICLYVCVCVLETNFLRCGFCVDTLSLHGEGKLLGMINA